MLTNLGLSVINRCIQATRFYKYNIISCSRTYTAINNNNNINNSATKTPDLSQYPIDKIRNFCIIAHIDHGKSTLADRLLELTGAISKENKNFQVLDKLQVERSRGITVKAQTASLFYYSPADQTHYLLNLIDTPGHVDFSYEVSRSLAACNGALLLVDATHGIQAQTLANFWMAFSESLEIIPLINKIDLPTANIENTSSQIVQHFGFNADEILGISAKHGTGIEAIFPRILSKIPHPKGCPNSPFKALLFDSWFDTYRGVVCHILLLDGKLCKGDKIKSFHSKKIYSVLELGITCPQEAPYRTLYVGQVGFVVLGMKTAQEAFIGDTFHCPEQSQVSPMPGFKKFKAIVFAGIFPLVSSEYESLKDSIQRLVLNDSSVVVANEQSSALGRGWRLGFLGTLHMDVFKERLENEYKANIIFTLPTVSYKIHYKNLSSDSKSQPLLAGEGSEENIKIVSSIEDFPSVEEMRLVQAIKEPYVLMTIISPESYLGDIISFCLEKRGQQKDFTFLESSRIMLKFHIPLSEIIVSFFDELKSITSGFSSFDYEDAGYEESDIVKISCILNNKVIPDLSLLCHRSKSQQLAKLLVNKLKPHISRQLFEVAIQASIGNKIVARDVIKPYRKDVTAKCYGGDETRRKKLLEHQKEGRKHLKTLGNIELSRDAFLSIIKTNETNNNNTNEND